MASLFKRRNSNRSVFDDISESARGMEEPPCHVLRTIAVILIPCFIVFSIIYVMMITAIVVTDPCAA
jgi:hypothetical protein